MNRSESKYFHTAVKMDKALLSLLEKRILHLLPYRKSAEKLA